MAKKLEQQVIDKISSSKNMDICEKLGTLLSYFLQFTKEELEASQGEDKKNNEII